MFSFWLPRKTVWVHFHINQCQQGFHGGSEGKESAFNVGDPGLIPGSVRSPREGNCYPLQYSHMENSMDREPGGLQFVGLQRVGQDWAIKYEHNLSCSQDGSWWIMNFKNVAHGTFYILLWRVVTHIKAAHENFFFFLSLLSEYEPKARLLAFLIFFFSHDPECLKIYVWNTLYYGHIFITN